MYLTIKSMFQTSLCEYLWGYACVIGSEITSTSYTIMNSHFYFIGECMCFIVIHFLSFNVLNYMWIDLSTWLCARYTMFVITIIFQAVWLLIFQIFGGDKGMPKVMFVTCIYDVSRNFVHLNSSNVQTWIIDYL